MMAQLRITRAGPLATIQDRGRFGMLRHGIGASGPMDASAFAAAGAGIAAPGHAGIEFTETGLAFSFHGDPQFAGFAGGQFSLTINGQMQQWPALLELHDGDLVDIAPGPGGNYGYLRFDAEIDVPEVLGSRATNLIVGLGGHAGRALKRGDVLSLVPVTNRAPAVAAFRLAEANAPIRFIWGIHADLFDAEIRNGLVSKPFKISTRLDRMGVRLDDPDAVFSGSGILSLVSDAIVAGDMQILGDGTPIVLMRDHQPTGGYPRIATILSLDLDRFAQMRPGSAVRFQSVTPQRAQVLRNFASLSP